MTYQHDTNGTQRDLSIASLVLGILGFFLFPIILSVLAVILGKVTLSRIARGTVSETSRRTAQWGFWLGVGSLILVAVIVAAIAAFGSP